MARFFPHVPTAHILIRAQQNDRQMEEMEPPDSFTMKLRGYQKQALQYVPNHLVMLCVINLVSWMTSLESGEDSARESTSMHPLWNE